MPRPEVLVAMASLLGCAPLASFRPASGLAPDRSLELGAGAVLLAPRPYVDEPHRVTGQLWVSGQPLSFLTLSAIAAFDDEAAAGGGALRLGVRGDRFAGGVEAEAGWLWGALSIPLALRLFDETWLYGAPRVSSWGDEAVVSGLLGASVRVIDGLSVRLEAQHAWQDLQSYNRRWVLGAAVAAQLPSSR